MDNNIPIRSFNTVIQNVINKLEEIFPENIDLINDLKKLKKNSLYAAPEMNQIYWNKLQNILFNFFENDLIKPVSEIPENIRIVMRIFSGKN